MAVQYLPPNLPQPRRSLGQRLSAFVGGFRRSPLQRVREIIGNWTLTKPYWAARILFSKDTTWLDYPFWDALRRGRAPGYEIASMFLMPIAEKTTSYVFGDGFTVKLMDSAVSPGEKKPAAEYDGKRTQDLKAAGAKSTTNHPTKAEKAPGAQPIQKPVAKPGGSQGTDVDYTNMQLGMMVEQNMPLFTNVVVDHYGLGDQYVFCNMDGTFSVASPETVTCEYSSSDYHRLIKVVVRTKYLGSVVTETWTDDLRTVDIHYHDQRADVHQEYDNLIGRIPMVHFACNRSTNEIHGRPLYEAALPLMSKYDNISYKTHDGVEILGNPMPVFEGLDNPGETLALNSTEEQYTDENGQTQTRQMLRVDRNSAMVIGKGGNAKMLNPPVGFTKDSLDVQHNDYLLLLDHTHLPEFLFSATVNSSKANVETQMPPFIRYIGLRRLQLQGEGANPMLGTEARGGFLALFDIWLRTVKLLNPAIVVGPVRMTWPTIDAGDALTKYQYVSLFSSTGKMTDEDAIAASGYWKDPAAIVARAQGKKVRAPSYDDFDAKLRKAKLEAAQKATSPNNDNGHGFMTDWPGGQVGADGSMEHFSIIGPMTIEDEIGRGNGYHS